MNGIGRNMEVLGEAYSRSRDFLADGILDRSQTPPPWIDEEAYSTATVPAVEFDEKCVMAVYPRAVNCQSALSIVMVSEDLDSAPNQVLVQQLLYPTPAIAEANFDRVAREAIDIFGVMLITQPGPHETDDQDGQVRRLELSAWNGVCKATHIERRDNMIFILRSSQRDSPPWEFIDTWVDEAAALPMDESTTINVDGEWRVVYGPVDFHPSGYEAPSCS